MIEFTLSRVAMVACGLVLLAAIAAPFAGIFENNNGALYQEQCDNISEMIDSFCESETEEIIVNADDFLPSDSFVRFENRSVILEAEGKEYKSSLKHAVCFEGEIGNGDCVKISKKEDCAVIELL